jgi:hypothetical protein
MKTFVAIAFLFAASAAFAETPAPAADRMQELHRIMNDPGSSPDDRRAAKAELLRLLRSDNAQVPAREMPPRAAIIPTPNPVIGTQRNPPVATVTVPPPSSLAPAVGATLNPATGSVLTPSGRTAVDSRTGRIANEVPGGYIDPATGRFTPKP